MHKKRDKVKKLLIKGNNMALLIGLFLIWNLPSITAQAGGNAKNTSITGVFKGSLEPAVQLEVDQRFIDNSVQKLETQMKNDSFRFDFQLSVPQTVTIKYLRNQANIYIEPGQTLHIDADANSFYFSFEFKGKSAANNNFLREFSQKYKAHYPNTFQMFRYKKGIVWYKVHRDMDSHMRGKAPAEFTSFMLADKTEKMATLQSYELSGKGALTEDFKAYMWSEIHYYWGYHMLTYGYAFGFFHNMDFQEFFNFMNEVPLQNDKTLGSMYYREFIIGAVNYYCEGPLKLPDPENDKMEEQLLKQFEYGSKALEGKPKAYFLSEIIRLGFKENVIKDMQPAYNTFIKENPYKEFNRRIQ
jgi:hypothetical protein